MLSIDISLVVIFAIVWILVVVLSKVYFNPLRRVMSQRDGQIQQDQDAARDALDKYARVIQRIEEEISAAKATARETREEWAREAQKEKENMIEEVSQDCRQQVQKAHREMDERIRHLKKELAPQSHDLAEKIAKRLLS